MSGVEIPTVRHLYWSVRRELWETRSIYLGPLALGGIILIGFFIALFTLPARARTAQALGAPQLREAIEQPYVIAAIILMTADLAIAVFYCIDALYGERRDRSILFWKSLPVSDATAVLAKASIPIVVLPLVTFGATVIVQAVMLLSSSVVLSAAGLGASLVWDQVSLFDIWRINFGHLVVFHGLWYSPVYAWLLLASASATRVPLLWAALPPVAIVIVERVAFNSRHFAALVLDQFFGGGDMSSSGGHLMMTMDMLFSGNLSDLLFSPGMALGLLISAPFLWAAVQFRRYRSAM
jgi:ABC-2 type transport system permease protein